MRLSTWLGTGLSVAALGLSAFWAAPAHAVNEINIDHVEAADDNSVSVLLAVDGLPSGATAEPDTVTVEVNGESMRAQAQPVEAGEIERTTVLALDASRSMQGERFEAAKSAAKSFLASAPPDVRVGLLTFSGGVRDITPPTTDHVALEAAIDNIELTLGTQVYDAVTRAVELAGDEGARSVLLLSDGKDDGQGASLDDAVTAVSQSGTVVDVVAVQQDAATRDLLTEIADVNGGSVIEADDPSALDTLFAAQGEALAQQLLVTFPYAVTAAEEATVEISLVASGETFADSAFVTLSPSSSQEALEVVEPSTPLVDETGLWLGGGALAVGVTLVAGTVLLRRPNRPTFAEQQLSYYSGTPQTDKVKGGAHAGAPAAPQLRMAAVGLTEKMVKGDFETRLAQRLSGAGIAFTAAEWLLLHAGLAVGAAFVGMVLGGLKLLVLLLIAGAVVPWLVLKRKHSKRLAAFNGQLAETLQLISGGLSAGLSLPQGIDTVVREGQEPMAGELRRALMEARLGVDIEDALEGVGERMESEDFSWVVMAIRIQREVGGNLAELLNTVSDTLRERDYLRRQVRVLSAEGRISAYVLGGLPIVMFLYMLLVRPDAIRPLYTEPLGMVMAAAAIFLLIAGFFTLSKLVKVEV